MSEFRWHYSLYGLNLRANRVIAGLRPVTEGVLDDWMTINFAGPLEEGLTDLGEPFLRTAVETVWQLYDGERTLVEYRAPQRGYVWTALHSNDRIDIRWNHDAILEDIAPILHGPGIAPSLHRRDVLALHACVVKVDDEAIAVMGAPGSGKSTTAAACLGAGHAIVSDDLATIDAERRVEWGPTQLRVYRDSARAAELDANLLTRLYQEPLLGDKYRLMLPEPPDVQALPLRALYFLQERMPSHTDTTITSVDRRAVVPLLMANVYAPRLLTRRHALRSLTACIRLASSVRVHRVQAAGGLGRLNDLVTSIVSHVRAARASAS